MKALEDEINAAIDNFFGKPDGWVSHLLLNPGHDRENYLVGFLRHGPKVLFRVWPCVIEDGELHFGSHADLRYAICTQHGMVKSDGWWKVDFPVTMTGNDELQFREPMQVTLLALRRAQEILGEAAEDKT